MKKFNGTDYDGLLPLAYNALSSENSKLFNGKSYSETMEYIESNNLFLYTGEYRGNGLYRESNPNSITFPFVPKLIVSPNSSKVGSSTGGYGDAIIYPNQVTQEYAAGGWQGGVVLSKKVRR